MPNEEEWAPHKAHIPYIVHVSFHMHGGKWINFHTGGEHEEKGVLSTLKGPPQVWEAKGKPLHTFSTKPNTKGTPRPPPLLIKMKAVANSWAGVPSKPPSKRGSSCPPCSHALPPSHCLKDSTPLSSLLNTTLQQHPPPPACSSIQTHSSLYHFRPSHYTIHKG